MKLTITLHSYTIWDKYKQITKADHDIVQAICKSEPAHRMDTGRVVAYTKDALKNLDRHVEKFIKDLKERIYDDVTIDEIIIVDNLERNLPQK